MIDVKSLLNFNPQVVLISTSAEVVPGDTHIEDELSVAQEALSRGIPFAVFASDGWPNVAVSGVPLWDEKSDLLAHYESEAVRMALATNKIVDILEKIGS